MISMRPSALNSPNETTARYYLRQINSVLEQRGVVPVGEPAAWSHWAGPAFLGADAFAFVLNEPLFPGRHLERLYDKKTVHAISTRLGGRQIGYLNSRGFAYVVFDSLVPELKPVEVLKVLKDIERALVVADTDGGKTTLLQHVLAVKDIPPDDTVILDPHAKVGVWPDRCHVIGWELDYEAIMAEFDNLYAEMKKRFKLRARGDEAEFGPMLIVIEEGRSVLKKAEGSERLIELITEGRKVKMQVFVGSHSSNVATLGFEGEGDLRTAFVTVRIKYNQLRKTRKTTMEFGDGTVVPGILPGPYPPEATREEKIQEVLRLVNVEGMSRNAACQQVFGRGYAGDLVDDIRRAAGEI